MTVTVMNQDTIEIQVYYKLVMDIELRYKISINEGVPELRVNPGFE